MGCGSQGRRACHSQGTGVSARSMEGEGKVEDNSERWAASKPCEASQARVQGFDFILSRVELILLQIQAAEFHQRRNRICTY